MRGSGCLTYFWAIRSVDPTSVLLVSEPAAIRRNLTLQHGATAALDPIHTDVPAAAREATGGVGPDVVFDAAGVQITLETAIASVRVRGVVVNVAIWEGIGHVDMNAILMKEIFVTGERHRLCVFFVGPTECL